MGQSVNQRRHPNTRKTATPAATRAPVDTRQTMLCRLQASAPVIHSPALRSPLRRRATSPLTVHNPKSLQQSLCPVLVVVLMKMNSILRSCQSLDQPLRKSSLNRSMIPSIHSRLRSLALAARRVLLISFLVLSSLSSTSPALHRLACSVPNGSFEFAN